MKAQGGRRLNRRRDVERAPQKKARSGPTPAQRKLMQKELEGRRSGGLEEARKAQAALEARMAREAAQPARGRVPGADWAPPVVEKVPTLAEITVVTPQRTPRKKSGVPADAQGNGKWTLGQARSMLRAGYHLNKVVRVTGFGIDAFLDMKLDDDGYGLPLTE